MLYLCSILTDDGLNDNTFLITCNEISNKLGIANLITFKGSLDYLLSVGYDYKLYSQSRWYSVDSIIVSYKQYRGHFEIIVNDEFINLLGKTRQFYQIPKLLLNSDIRYYKHSLFIANYILLHQRRNKGKKNENTISVKELLKNCPLMPLYNDLNPEQRQVKRKYRYTFYIVGSIFVMPLFTMLCEVIYLLIILNIIRVATTSLRSGGLHNERVAFTIFEFFKTVLE